MQVVTRPNPLHGRRSHAESSLPSHAFFVWQFSIWNAASDQHRLSRLPFIGTDDWLGLASMPPGPHGNDDAFASGPTHHWRGEREGW